MTWGAQFPGPPLLLRRRSLSLRVQSAEQPDRIALRVASNPRVIAVAIVVVNQEFGSGTSKPNA